MTATSGRRLYELYASWMPPPESPLGAFSRMLLATSVWGSTRCFLTWKLKATPHGRLLFRLAPSTPRTGETECGLLPTMRAGLTGNITQKRCNDKNRNLEKALALMMFPTPHASCSTGAGTSGRQGGMNLQTAVAFLPTPAARDWKSGKSNQHGKNSRPLNEVILLPTPKANKPEGYSGHGFRPTLNQVVTGEDKPVSGSLCPEFVREMMGYPTGWLD